MQRAELGRSWRVLGRETGRQAGWVLPGREGCMRLGLSGDWAVGPGGLIEGLDHTWSVKQGWLLG